MSPPAPDGGAPSARPPAIELPTIERPKGGGALRAISDRFRAGASSGTGALSIGLSLSSGRGGFTPGLTLDYDSGGGNGPFGLGWSLSLPEVARRTARGVPQYGDHDDIALSGGDPLVPVGASTAIEELGRTYQVQRYRPRVDVVLTRVERWIDALSGEVHWRTRDARNVLAVFGLSASARIDHPTRAGATFRWLLEEQRDDKGNVAAYEYLAEDLAGVDRRLASEAHRGDAGPARYLHRVRYGNRTPSPQIGGAPVSAADYLFEVVLDYGQHAQGTPAIDGPWGLRPDAFSNYRAGFELRWRRRCQRVLMFHHFPELGGAARVRATELGYDDDPAASRLVSARLVGWRDDVSARHPRLELGYQPPVFDDRLHLIDGGPPAGVDGSAAQWVDLDGEGLPGILSGGPEGWSYRRPEGGGQFGAPVPVAEHLTGVAVNDPAFRLVDLDGDGQLELAAHAGALAGYQPRDGGPFRPFTALPNVDFSSPELRFVDLDGDGLADILIGDDDVFVCYRSLGRAGFEPIARIPKPSDDRAGPAVAFRDRRCAVLLADMSGGGLTDIVRVSRQGVDYWPNLGHGRFGARVTMDRAPNLDDGDGFDPARVRLFDVDGSGPADLVHLGRTAVTVWMNQAGNGWSGPREIRGLPLPDRLAGVSVIDLLGQGTGCLVWSAGRPREPAALAYVDLTSGRKPGLLVSTRNNLGAESRIEYEPSTRAYLEDRAAGQPWATRLHFPVHVVTRVEHVDHVARTRLVTRFRYRHGYFDPLEREFNGFAAVDQWDAETHDETRGRGLFNGAVEPPMTHTRTWFDTGAHRDRPALAAALAREYAPDAAAVPALGAAAVIGATDDDEHRQAARALRGRLLRQEIYGEGARPLVVTQQGYAVHRLAAPAAGWAVFTVLPRENVTATYEGGDEPRVAHELVLAADAAHGHLQIIVNLAYGRVDATALPEQRMQWGVWTEHDAAHVDVLGGAHRLGAATETRTYQLDGLPPGPLTAGDLLGTYAALVPLPFETPPQASPARRWLTCAQTRYWTDDLAAERAPGTAGSRALVRRMRVQAGTAGLPALALALPAGAVPPSDADWIEAGHELADGAPWVSTGVVHYDPAWFYVPARLVDPFGAPGEVEYDDYRLFVVRAVNAAGLETRAVIDYHALAARSITDPNDNLTLVAFDPLGVPRATAMMGKSPAEGHDLDHPSVTYAWDRTAWEDHPVESRPASLTVRSRTAFGADQRALVTHTYYDGSGREVLVKTGAEPGLAPPQDALGRLLRDPAGDPLPPVQTTVRWVGSGRVVFNAKGQPFKRYEPYFASVPAYEDEPELRETGVTSVLHYDALGRVARAEHPDGTEERTERGAWWQRDHDRSDTVATSAWYARASSSPDARVTRAAALSFDQRDTPVTAHLDAMGRVAVVEEAGDRIRTDHDVAGRVVAVVDARGNRVCRRQYDMLGRLLHEWTADGGDRFVLPAADEQPARSWDGEGRSFAARYDRLRRPIYRSVAEGGQTRGLERVVYGDQLGAAANLRGRPYRTYDGDGLHEVTRYHFSGVPLEERRRLAADPAALADWSPLALLTDPGDLALAAEAALEPITRRVERMVDALGRVEREITPDLSETRSHFSARGLLERQDVRLRGAASWTPIVEAVDYDALGRCTRLQRGNGVTTTHAHDPLSQRLRRLVTTRANGTRLQDLELSYDAYGDVVQIDDDAQPTVYFANAAVSATRLLRYDARHRLVAATGREHPGQAPGPTDAPLRPIPHANDAQSLARYDETYHYDGANNLLEVVHRRAGQVIWRQRHQYAETSNRLLATGDAAEAAQPTYRDAADLAHSYAGVVDSEPRGAITAFPHVVLTWDAEQRLRTATRGQVQRTYYRYDATGARLRKVTVDLLTQARRERIVLGRFEIEQRRAPGGSIVEDVEILHFFAGADRVATVETQTVEAGEPATSAPRLRYVTSDHLGSSCLETGPTVAAPVLTYEEYRPYGSCAYRAARPELGLDPKRYRFCGKERDQETGLDYVGARYYAAWIGRWISPDPTGPAGGLNAYAYAGASPLRRVDPSGEADEDALPDPDQLREAVDQQMLALTDLKEQLDQVLPEAIRAWEDQSTLDRLNTLPELQKLLDLNKQIPALLRELQTLRNMYGDASVMGRTATRVHLATKNLFAHIIQFQLLVASLILDPIPTVVSLAAVESAHAAGVENPILLGLISLGASIATASAVVTVTSAMERAAVTRSIASAARPLGRSAGAMAADDVARPTVYLDENIYYLEDAFKKAGWPVERVVAGTSDDAIRAALEPKIMEGSAVFVTQNFKDFRGMRLVRVGSGLPPDQQARVTVDMVYYTTNYPGFWKQFVQAPASPLNKGHWRALFKTARGG